MKLVWKIAPWLLLALGIISPLTVSAAMKKVAITPATLRVRTLPGTDGAIVGYVGKGQKFDLLSEMNGWYEIEFEPEITGWIVGKYATISGAASSSSVVPPNLGTITVDLLKVRTGASASSAVIGYIGKDQIYPIIGKSRGWLKIRDEQGTMGWVLGTYVTMN